MEGRKDCAPGAAADIQSDKSRHPKKQESHEKAQKVSIHCENRGSQKRGESQHSQEDGITISYGAVKPHDGDKQKKVDGRELRRVDYIPRKSDLEIQLYFESDTFRHVMTVYLFAGSPNHRLEERFADFKSIDNVMLPGRWTIEFTNGQTRSITRYEVTQEKISHNITLDPGTFDVR